MSNQRDDEILAALKCCGSAFGQDCAKCPYEYCSKQCENLCMDAAIKIEELKAENAWLRRQVAELKASEETNDRIDGDS